MGEAGLLRRLQQLLGRPWRTRASSVAALRRGVGDDAAVVPVPAGAAGAYTVLSSDMLVEDVDFRRRWASFADVGHKAAAVNLSDLAAMGAAPAGLLLSLAVRPQERVADVLALVRALDREGRRLDAPLLGGDLSRTTGPLVAAVTAFGFVGNGPGRGGAPLPRCGGQLGDVVMVGGTLGAARAGLALLEGEVAMAAGPGRAPRWLPGLLRRQRRPQAQVALGQLLGQMPAVHAAVDLSDGLAADALHLPGKGHGVVLDLAALPLAPGVAEVAARLTTKGKNRRRSKPKDATAAPALPVALAWALAGGEDFVLAVAVSRRGFAGARTRAARAGFALTPVGRIVAVPGLHLVGHGRYAGPVGYDHFANV